MTDPMLEVRKAIEGLTKGITNLAKKQKESNRHHTEERERLERRVANLEQRNDGGGSS